MGKAKDYYLSGEFIEESGKIKIDSLNKLTDRSRGIILDSNLEETRTQRIIKEILTDGKSLKYHVLSLEIHRDTFRRWRIGEREPRGQRKNTIR